MSHPIHLSDRMPQVARGTAPWSPEEMAHLTHCAECRAEWKVVELGAGLGAEMIGGMDLAGIAARVVADRLAEPRYPGRCPSVGLHGWSPPRRPPRC